MWSTVLNRTISAVSEYHIGNEIKLTIKECQVRNVSNNYFRGFRCFHMNNLTRLLTTSCLMTQENIRNRLKFNN